MSGGIRIWQLVPLGQRELLQLKDGTLVELGDLM